MYLENEEEILNAFDNLIYIMEEIYDLTVGKLAYLELDGIKDRNDFENTIKRVNTLKKKEKRVLNKIGLSDYYTSVNNEINDRIDQIRQYDNDKANAIALRLNIIFEDIACNEEEAQKYIDEGNEYYETEEGIIIPAIFDYIDFIGPIELEFLKHLQTLNNNLETIKYKYYSSFIYPKLEDAMTIARYNPENVSELSDELTIESYKVDKEEYMDSKKINLYHYIDNSFDWFFELATDERTTKERLLIAFERAKYFILKQDPTTVSKLLDKYFNQDIEYVFIEEAIPYVNELAFEMTALAFTDKEIYSKTLGEIDSIDLPPLNKKGSDLLFDMIDSSKDVYLLLSKLYKLEIEGKKYTDDYKKVLGQIKPLLDRQKKDIKVLYIDKENEDTIEDIIDYYLGFSLSLISSNKLMLPPKSAKRIIKANIMNLLFNDDVIDTTLYEDESEASCIIKNYQLECLQEFEKAIDNTTEKEDYLKYKYNMIATDFYLTEDYVITGGQIRNAPIYDDYFSAKIFDIDEDEYTLDKEKLLTNHLYAIIGHLATIHGDHKLYPFEEAYIDYEIIGIKTALKYINELDANIIKSEFSIMRLTENEEVQRKLDKIFPPKKDKQLTKKRQ